MALKPKHRLCKPQSVGYLATMSTVQEIEAAIPKLSRAELEQFHAWFEDYVEDRLELTDEVKASRNTRLLETAG